MRPVCAPRRTGARLTLVAGVVSMTLAAGAGAQRHGEGESIASEPLASETTPEVIRTDNYEVHISPLGGLPVRWDLVTTTVGDAAEDGEGIGLIDGGSLDLQLPRPLEIAMPGASELNRAPHRLERVDDDQQIVVRCVSPPTPAGLKVIRTYHIPRRGFETRISLQLVNESQAALAFEGDNQNLGLRLGPGLDVALESSGGLGSGLYNYVRAVYKMDGEVESPGLSIDEPEDAPAGSGIVWGGIHSRYFAAILAPEPELGAGDAGRFRAVRAWLPSQLTADAAVDDEIAVHPLIELTSEPFSLAPGESIERTYTFFFGPKERRALESTRFGLEDILFPILPGWLRWLCFLLLSMLTGLHAVLYSWGLSIIALAAAIRVITSPVAHVGLKQQAEMAAQQARLKPFIAEIDEKFKGDAARHSQELMRLYKEHGVNPFAAFKGCLWVFLQVPIFVALFNILGQAFELRGASFLWLRDLSQPDRLFSWSVDLPLLGSHFNLLPVVMAVTQVVVTQLSTMPEADPSESAKQKKFMLLMAVFFLFLFYSFPSGLVLYWTVANLGQLIQHRLMVRLQTRKSP